MKIWSLEADSLFENGNGHTQFHATFVKTYEIVNFIDNGLKGRKLFITGSKGQGKTTVLKYLSAEYRSNTSFNCYPENKLLEDVGRIRFNPKPEHYQKITSNIFWENFWELTILTFLAKKLDIELPIEIETTIGEATDFSDIMMVFLINIDKTESITTLSTKNLKSIIFENYFSKNEHKIALFVDNIDEASLFDINNINAIEIWIIAQVAFMYVSRELLLKTKNIRIFSTIRLEAYLSSRSSKHRRLFEYSTIIKYSKDDLKNIFIKNINMTDESRFANSQSDDPFVKLFGYKNIPFKFFSDDNEKEKNEHVFDLIYRYTFRRPREIIYIGSRIVTLDMDSRNFESIRNLVRQCGDEFLRQYQKEIILAFDTEIFSEFLQVVQTNVIENKFASNIVDYFLKKRKIKNIISLFYNLGLLGIIKTNEIKKNTTIFRDVGNYDIDNIFEPVFSKYYLLHPVFDNALTSIFGINEYYNKNIIGYNKEFLEKSNAAKYPHKSLYENMGFSKNPFSNFSAEEEVEYIDDIFNPPKYFDSLLSDLMSGSSRFIFGERGSGKTALMLKLKNVLTMNQYLVAVISDYSDIPLNKNIKYFVIKIIENLVENLALSLINEPARIKKLSSPEKEKLAYIIKIFFKTNSNEEFAQIYNKITKYKIRNFLKNIYNWLLLKPVNTAVSAGIEIFGDIINRSLSLPEKNHTTAYKEYFPKLSLEDIKNREKDFNKFNYMELKYILTDFSKIINGLGYNNLILFFDKIDESKILGSRIDNIVMFLKDILLDTDFLQTNNLSLVFILWSKLKSSLGKEGVRFDKFKPLDIFWNKDELLNILNYRLSYFSNKEINDIKLLFHENSEIIMEKLLHLSKGSPRNLLMVLSSIYDNQSNNDIHTNRIFFENFEEGITIFAKKYSFEIHFPINNSHTYNIKKVVNRILKLGKLHFQRNDFISTFEVSNKTAGKHIKIMINYGLIEESIDLDSSNRKIYRVTDPRIEHLIENKISHI